eukprot:jgi/Undpi1/2166/HiC_scaffold_12.g05552.m1
MSPAPGSQFFMALELGLAWAGFLPLLPLLTAPRRDNGEEAPSTFLRLACAAAATTGAVAAASVLRARARSSNSGGGGGRRSEGAIIVRMVARGIAGLLVGTIAIHATSVVLGAPVLRKFPETFAFSVLMAALTSLPVSVSSPQPLQACAGFLRRTRPPVYEEGAMVPAAGCAIGAWLGAIPLCLDWEQPWQQPTVRTHESRTTLLYLDTAVQQAPRPGPEHRSSRRLKKGIAQMGTGSGVVPCWHWTDDDHR